MLDRDCGYGITHRWTSRDPRGHPTRAYMLRHGVCSAETPCINIPPPEHRLWEYGLPKEELEHWLNLLPKDGTLLIGLPAVQRVPYAHRKATVGIMHILASHRPRRPGTSLFAMVAR
jgi:hypothetical protein